MLSSLTEAEVKRSGMPVLDVFLAQEAQARDQRLGSIESAAEVRPSQPIISLGLVTVSDCFQQCDPLNSLDTDQVGERSLFWRPDRASDKTRQRV